MQRIYQGRKRRVQVAALFSLLGVTAVAVGLAATSAGSIGPPPASIGDQMDRALPGNLLGLPFTDQAGHTTTLSQYAGRAALLVPFLTSCQEECPITTGALDEIQRALVADHLSSKVQIVEVTVDPGRDTPERTLRVR